MYNEQKIGVGIITYNRPEKFARLLNQIKDADYIDTIVIVKNKNIEYNENDPVKFVNDKIHFIHEPNDVGVGKCKNLAMSYMLNNDCKHIFVIEDDIIIKKTNVFKKYIDVAKEFNLGHLNFCRAWDSITKKYLFPFVTINGKNEKLQLFRRLCGDFQYFTQDALLKVGLIDDVNYINALEHAEHTYRMSLHRFYTPFNAFADIADSTEYIEDDGVQSSIDHNTDQYNQRVQIAIKSFIHQYGYSIGQIPIPTLEHLNIYFRS